MRLQGLPKLDVVTVVVLVMVVGLHMLDAVTLEVLDRVVVLRMLDMVTVEVLVQTVGELVGAGVGERVGAFVCGQNSVRPRASRATK